MKKFKIALVCITIFSNMSVNAKISDWFSKKPNPENKILTYEDRPKPFKDYFVLNTRIYDIETLSDYVGSIIVLYTDSKGTLKVDVRADKTLKDNSKKPLLKLTNKEFQSILLDTSSAIIFGLPLIESNMNHDDKMAYKFYTNANSSIDTNDLDKKKYLELEKAVIAEFKEKKELKLEEVRIITSAAILNTSYSAMRKSNTKARVAVSGWQIGGEFYSSDSNSEEQNLNDIGIISKRFTAEFLVPVSSTASPPPPILTGSLPSSTVSPVTLNNTVSTNGLSPDIDSSNLQQEEPRLNADSTPNVIRRFAAVPSAIIRQPTSADAKRKPDEDSQRQKDRARLIAEEEAKRKAEIDRARLIAAEEAQREAAKSVVPNISLSGKQGIPIPDSQKSPSESSFKKIIQIQ